MKYVILPAETDIAKGWALSAAVYAFSRPPEIKAADDVTAYYTSPVQHPTTGAVALPLPETETIKAHPQSTKDGVLALLSPYLTQAEIDGLTTLMPAVNGTRVNVLTVIQDNLPSLAGQVNTYTQLDNDGWFIVS